MARRLVFCIYTMCLFTVTMGMSASCSCTHTHVRIHIYIDLMHSFCTSAGMTAHTQTNGRTVIGSTDESKEYTWTTAALSAIIEIRRTNREEMHGVSAGREVGVGLRSLPTELVMCVHMHMLMAAVLSIALLMPSYYSAPHMHVCTKAKINRWRCWCSIQTRTSQPRTKPPHPMPTHKRVRTSTQTHAPTWTHLVRTAKQ